MTQPASPTPRFDTFYKWDELTRLLFAYAEAHPTLVAVLNGVLGDHLDWQRRHYAGGCWLSGLAVSCH